MRLAADGADGAERRAADARGEARIGAAAGELAVERPAEILHRRPVGVEQRLRALVLDERLELALDRERRRGARHGRAGDDLLDAAHGVGAVRRRDVAQVDLALGRGRDGVDRLPAGDQPDVHRRAARDVGDRMQRDDLVRELADGAHALLEVAAGVGGLAGDLHLHEDAALAAGHDVAGGSPGLGVEHRAGVARRLLDDRPAGGRADLLVRGDEPDERRRRAAELVVGRKHEGVHHEPGLHVADARPIGAPVVDPERAPARLPLREHGVAVSHEHDRLVRSAGRADMGLDGIAEALVRHHRRLDAVLGEKAAEALADRVHARLVIGAGIDVHDLLEKGEHRVALAREPGGDGAGIGRGHRTSGRLGQGAALFCMSRLAAASTPKIRAGSGTAGDRRPVRAAPRRRRPGRGRG